MKPQTVSYAPNACLAKKKTLSRFHANAAAFAHPAADGVI
jgi:hypothetical protein